MSLSRQIRLYLRPVLAIGVFALIAVVAGIYILSQQRLRNPFADRYTIKAEFQASTGLTPGLGQPVNVAGVRVGDIASATLEHGRAVVSLSIDPNKLPKVYADATAVLHPNTPLQDLQIDIAPGGRGGARALKDGDEIPVANTTIPAASDDFLDSLDVDSRDWFQGLVTAFDQGTRGRASDLRGLLRSFGPTTRQLHRIGAAVVARRHELRRVTHNLAVLTQAASTKDRDLSAVVDAGNAIVQALASQDAALGRSLDLLPGTLARARTTLAHGARFARVLRPALTDLQPAADRLAPALRAAREPLALATPLLRDQVRPLVRALQPVAADLGPTTRDLYAVTPSLRTAFVVLNYLANELGYNPAGDQEGYLFWTAWFAHNTASVTSTEDGNGAVLRGLALLSCSSLSSQPGLAAVYGLLGNVLPACPKVGG